MAISIRNIVKQSVKFNVVSIISLLIQIPNQLIIGMFLIPEEYGIISFLALWALYAGLINPGMFIAGQREIPYLMGKKEEKQSVKVQNISISSDLLYSILPFLVILCASFFYSNKIIKIGLILTAISFIVNRFSTYWSSVNFIKQRFTIVAIGRLIGTILSPIIIIGSIYWLGIYAVLTAPLISAVFTVIYYLIRGPIGYHFQLEWSEVLRLIRIGLIFSLSGIIFYGYRMADRTIIASFLPLHDLGLFTFAMGFIIFGMNFFSDFGRVLEPILWEHSGKVKNPRESFSYTKRMAIYIALVTAMIIPLVQVGYDITVKLIVHKYIESIPLFLILSNMLYLASMATIPNIILNSVVVNKQALVTSIYAMGVGINIVLDLFMIHVGYGIGAIAFVTILSQGMVAFASYFLVRKYMFTLPREFFYFIISIFFPFSISALFSIFHGFLGSTTLSPWLFAPVSLVTQAIIWSFILNVFYQNYFPRHKVVNFAKELYELGTAEIRRKLKAITVTTQ
jgi:O-antigen/teichoic acid export membrane protein